MVLRTYLERVSMRGIQRIFGVVPRTLLKWLEQALEQLPNLAQSLMPAQADDILELDELWSFVLRKSNKRWVWIALCRRTRQVVAYYVGDRSQASCRQLWQRIPPAYKQCLSYSDFWEAYQQVFPRTLISRWVRRVVKRLTSNVGTTPYVNAWLVLSVRPFPFPNQNGFTT